MKKIILIFQINLNLGVISMKCLSPVVFILIIMVLLISYSQAVTVKSQDLYWSIENQKLTVNFIPKTSEISVKDKNANYVWKQGSILTSDIHLKNGSVREYRSEKEAGVTFIVKTLNCDGDIKVQMTLADDTSDLRIVLQGDKNIKLDNFNFPKPFIFNGPEGFNVSPYIFHGIMEASNSNNPGYEKYDGYRDRKSRLTERFISLYSDWSLNMPWAATVDMDRGLGYMAILETPDDAGFILKKSKDGNIESLGWQPVWNGQLGKFGYTRKILYKFTDSGGYNTISKLYRNYAIEQGTFVSMQEKIKQRPILKDFVGSAYFPASMSNLQLLLDTGIWARRFGYSGIFNSPWDRCKQNSSYIWKYDKLGIRPGMWSCFKDIIPKDETDWSLVQTKEDGTPKLGWICSDKTWMPAVCYGTMQDHADKYLPHLINTSNVNVLHHDTTCACGIEQCYNPKHPGTRSDDKKWRIEYLQSLTSYGAAVGVEAARDWAVPVLDYMIGCVEGNDGGEFHPANMPDAIVPVPIFNLVYHDAVMGQFNWFYTPQNMNKVRAIDILYATSIPTFGEGIDLCTLKRMAVLARFYEKLCTSEMLSHEHLTPGRMVQKCNYAGNAFAVTNLAEKNYIYKHNDKDYNLPQYGYIAKASDFFAVREKTSNGIIEYFQTTGCFSLDSTVPCELDWIKTNHTGASVTFLQTHPKRILLTIMTPATLNFEPTIIAPGWDCDTTRIFRINENDERIEEMQLQRDSGNWFSLKNEGKNDTYEMVCGENVSVPDFKVISETLKFSNTQLKGGEKITVSASIANIGQAQGECKVTFYCDTIDKQHAFGTTVLSIQPGNDFQPQMVLDTSQEKWGISGLTGRHNIWVVAESIEDETEINMINNGASDFINIGPWYHAKYLLKGFDFGKDATESGFIAAGNETYTKQRGWGWTSQDDINDIVTVGIVRENKEIPDGRGIRLVEEGPLMCDMVVFPGRPALMESYQDRHLTEISRDYTFNVDLPNGKYELALLLVNGERVWQTEKMLADIYVEEKMAINHETIKHKKGHFVIPINVEINDGQLNITFKGRWWQLSAITIRHSADTLARRWPAT